MVHVFKVSFAPLRESRSMFCSFLFCQHVYCMTNRKTFDVL
uniref:Uncharacterized protein n=1 Tax=Anguilla anguilla TaxID=7936 RepID=A0A0E9WMV4_ANGAN